MSARQQHLGLRCEKETAPAKSRTCLIRGSSPVYPLSGSQKTGCMGLGCVPVRFVINRRGTTTMTHDQMAFAVSKLYPDLARWKDYWVAHPVESGSDKQIGEAEIAEWRADAPKPDLKTLKKTFNTHADEFNAQQVKAIRRAKLIGSDWTQLMDVPEQTRTQWAVYRQLLRDLPQQKDFPSQIVWPKPPTY